MVRRGKPVEMTQKNISKSKHIDITRYQNTKKTAEYETRNNGSAK